MAKYFLLISNISRGHGSRVTRAAAYRAGERIVDTRTRESFNYSGRQDVVHKEVLLPSALAGRADMSWARDRATLWNAAEQAGKRSNSRLAREVLVLLPPELDQAQRANLARGFSQHLADKYHSAVDLTVHEPRPGSDKRHHHAHLLMTVREVTPAGFGPRISLELNGTDRHARGLGSFREEYSSIRERWAAFSNEALQSAGSVARVDHRSFKAQGLDVEPTPVIPRKVYYAEKKSGLATRAGESIRAQYQERVVARLAGPEAYAQVLRRQKAEARERVTQSSRSDKALTPPLDNTAVATVTDEAVRRWQEFRAREPPTPTAEQSLRNWAVYREATATLQERSGKYGMERDDRHEETQTSRVRDYDAAL